MLGRGRIGIFDPRNAADHVGAAPHRLAHQLFGAGLAHDAILREGHDLHVDDAAKLVAHLEQRVDPLEPGLAVDIGKGADVQIAVQRGQRNRAPRVLCNPPLGIGRLDVAGGLDRGHRFAHAGAVVIGPRDVLGHRQGPHLAEMQVRISKGLGDQPAVGGNLFAALVGQRRRNRGDDAVPDRDVVEFAVATQPSGADDDVAGFHVVLSAS